MKTWFYAFSMCQSMFCAIPFPCHVWEEKARSKMLLCLPFVGLEIGLVWALLGWGLRALGVSALVFGVLMALVPFILTGFIHLDGFMDVSDAVGSCRDLEKRRAILKDSHVGSFAVINIVILMLSQFAFFASVGERINLWILVLIPAISRCGSALAVLVLPPMSTSQYHGQIKNRGQVVFVAVLLAALVTLGFVFFGSLGLACMGCLLGYGLALHHGYHSLEGMNGDISGYALTIAEQAAVLVLAIF